MGEFIEHIGDYRIHDARILCFKRNDQCVEVSLKSIDDEPFIVNFYGVKEINSYKCEKMIIYSIAEFREENDTRRFVFVNWDEEDDSKLEIVAADYKISFSS